jgi:hypothetical protein
MLIWNRRHLERVLSRYVEHYNTGRPHRGVDLQVRTPAPVTTVSVSPNPHVAWINSSVNFAGPAGSELVVRMPEVHELRRGAIVGFLAGAACASTGSAVGLMFGFAPHRVHPAVG